MFNAFENNLMFGVQWNVSMFNAFENNLMFGVQWNVSMLGVNRRRKKIHFHLFSFFSPKIFI